MAVTRNQPIAKAPRESRVRLGVQLFRRREELGFGDSRPRFYRATGVNKRYADDLENARRSNFDEPFLRHAARGYAVAYESVIDVAWGKADKLTPAGDAAPPAPAPAPEPAAAGPLGLPPSPFGDPVRDAADRPYAETIWKRYLSLPKHVTDPAGAQMFPGEPDDARAWDGLRGRFSTGDQVWVIADLRRWAAGRDNDNSGTGATSA